MLSGQKILVPELSESNRFTLVDSHCYYGDTACGITLGTNINESLYYILALLNSTLIEFYYKGTTVPKANRFYIYKTMFLKSVPIRRINFSDSAEINIHDRMVSLVQSMLDLHKRLSSAKTSHEKTAIQRQIEATDGQIDRLVYELYGLTDDEIRIVEEATGKP